MLNPYSCRLRGFLSNPANFYSANLAAEEGKAIKEKLALETSKKDYSETYSDKTALEKVTGFFGGAAKFIGMDLDRKISTAGSVVGNLLNGNLSNAWTTTKQYYNQEWISFTNTVKDNWQTIAGAALVGAGVGLAAVTFGLSTPLTVALVSAGIGFMTKRAMDSYSPVLNELSNTTDNAKQEELYWNTKGLVTTDVLSFAAGSAGYIGTAGFINPIILKNVYGVDASKLNFGEKLTLTQQWAYWKEGINTLNSFDNVNQISIVRGTSAGYWGRHFDNGNIRLNFRAFSECPDAIPAVASHEGIENAIYRNIGADRLVNEFGFYDYGRQETIVESLNMKKLGNALFKKSFSESVRAEIELLNKQIPSEGSVDIKNIRDIQTQAKNLAVLKNTDPALYTELKSTLRKLDNGEYIIAKSEDYSNIFNKDWSFLVGE